MDKDGTLALSGFSADLGLEGDGIPGGKQTGRVAAGSLSVNTKTQVMVLDGLTADLAGMSLKASAKGTKVMDAPDIQGSLDTGEFSPRQLMETLGLEAPVTADPAVLSKAVRGRQLPCGRGSRGAVRPEGGTGRHPDERRILRDDG